MKYTFDEDKKQLYCALIILDTIIDKGHNFVTNLLSVEDQKLIPIFQRMIDKGLLVVNDNHEYTPTDKGKELIDNFYQRFQEFIKFYDIYCAVDLESGEFAFSKCLDMSEEEFQNYINDNRWDDVRVAVCEFKKIDPTQMVFLSMLRDNRIDVTEIGWQSELLKDDIWDDITNICETAITMEQLSVDDQIKNIVTLGSELLKTLLEREKEEQNSQPDETETTVTTEIIEEEVVDDYDPYQYYNYYWLDPFYISPCWVYYYDTPYWW